MIQQILSAIIYVLTILVFLRALMSWFPVSRGNPIAEFLITTTEPILAPLRRIVPRMGMMDITPMVAMLLLYAIGRFVNSA